MKDIKNKLAYLKKSDLSKDNKRIIENFLVDEYQKNLKESSRSIIKTLNNNISVKNKEIGLLKSNMYYIKSYFIELAIQNLFQDKDTKIIILKKINDLKNKYTKLLNQKIKKN